MSDLFVALVALVTLGPLSVFDSFGCCLAILVAFFAAVFFLLPLCSRGFFFFVHFLSSLSLLLLY